MAWDVVISDQEGISVQLSGIVAARQDAKAKARRALVSRGPTRRCEGPHDGPPEGRVTHEPVPTGTWPGESTGQLPEPFLRFWESGYGLLL